MDKLAGLKILFEKIDVDKNRKIDYNEFIDAIIEKIRYYKHERLLEAFENFDKDGSGQINKKELLEILYAEKFKEKEIEKFIKTVDKNINGKISKEEFIALMKEE